MLTLSTLGFLLGSMIGEKIGGNFHFFNLVRSLSPAMFVLALVLRLRSPKLVTFYSAVALVAAFLWGVVHSPPRRGPKEGIFEVVFASGCAQIPDDLIVRLGDRIYGVRGRAVLGDLVQLSRQRDQHAGMLVEVVQNVGRLPLWCYAGRVVQQFLHRRIAQFPPDVAAWMEAFILGKQNRLRSNVVAAFKSVGLLHLLVLSGGHLSVIAGMCLLLSRLPWLVLYILGRLNAVRWISVCSTTTALTGVVLAAYCAAAGFSQSLQRSFLFYLVSHILPMIGFSKPTRWRIAASLFVQGLIFPVNFLSLSMLMSWCGALLLTAFVESSYLRSVWQIIAAAVQIQILFFASSLLFFGSAGILSIPTNLVFQPLFAALLPANIMALLIHSQIVDQTLVWCNRQIVALVETLAHMQGGLSIVAVEIPGWMTTNQPAGRLVLVAILVTFYYFAGLRGSRIKLS